jgi:hypothetical protein
MFSVRVCSRRGWLPHAYRTPSTLGLSVGVKEEHRLRVFEKGMMLKRLF